MSRAPIRIALVTLLALALGSPAAVAAQGISKMDRDRTSTMLEQVRKDIERSYYDSTFGGVDVAARFARAEEGIQRASSLGELLGHVAAAVAELDDSHTFFIPPRQTVRAFYGWEMGMIGDSCFVTHVTPDSDADAKGLREGDAVLNVVGLVPARDNLWKLLYLIHVLRPQSSLRVIVRSPGSEPRQLDLAAKVREGKRVVDLTGSDGGDDIWTLIREAQDSAASRQSLFIELGSDVLFWKLAQFDNFDRRIDDGVKRAQKAKTLILDLRGNGGGQEKALHYLLGALSPDDVVIGTRRERSRTTQLVARGRGEKAFGGRLILLVNAASASASEIVARVVQLGERGIVIGDRTAGAVMVGRTFSHSIGTERVIAYAVNVTVGDLVMTDGGRLERVGVTPNHIVVPTGADLAARRDPTLARAAELAGLTMTPAQAGALLRER
jgi:C-terminal processing protease CtpA/Prc